MNTLINFVPSKQSIFKQLLSMALLVLSLISATVASAAELTATVDRDTVIDGESVVLYIEGSNLQNTPDLTALLQNFDIIHSGQSNSQSVVNGKRSNGFTMRLELKPKNTGAVTIPAFAVSGVTSTPLTIEVVARGTPGVEPRDKVFAEVSVENQNPYVQEQVILFLKVFDDGNVSTGNPVFEGNGDYQVQALPGGREEIVERDGVQYRVQTYRYALFAQKSGDITIDAITIPGSVRDPNYNGNFFLRSVPTRRIELKTEPRTLTVKPRAAANTSNWWLPVKALELRHEWSDDIAAAKAGEPLTLTLEMVSAGATSTQLPQIPVPDIPGLKIYVDNPDLRSRADAGNLVSLRREKWSVIPNQSGQVTLPEVVVTWWDTNADLERRAVIPAQVLQVEGPPGTEPASAATDSVGGSIATDDAIADARSNGQSKNQIAGTSALLNSTELGETDNPGAAQSKNNISQLWFWIAVVSMTAWLATLAAWWWSARSSQAKRKQSVAPSSNDSEQKAFRRMRSLSKGQDSTAYAGAVLEWAHSRWAKDPVHNLPDVGVRLGSRQLTDEMRQLDQLRFSQQRSSDDRPHHPAVSLNAIQKQLEAALRQSESDTARDSTRESKIQSPHALPQL